MPRRASCARGHRADTGGEALTLQATPNREGRHKAPSPPMPANSNKQVLLPVLAHSVDAVAARLGSPRLRLSARNSTVRRSDPVTVMVALVVLALLPSMSTHLI